MKTNMCQQIDRHETFKPHKTYFWDGDSEGCLVGGRVCPSRVGLNESVGTPVGLDEGTTVGLKLGCSLGATLEMF